MQRARELDHSFHPANLSGTHRVIKRPCCGIVSHHWLATCFVIVALDDKCSFVHPRALMHAIEPSRNVELSRRGITMHYLSLSRDDRSWALSGKVPSSFAVSLIRNTEAILHSGLFREGAWGAPAR